MEIKRNILFTNLMMFEQIFIIYIIIYCMKF